MSASDRTFYSFGSNNSYVRGAVQFYAGYGDERLVFKCPSCGWRETEPVGQILLQPPRTGGRFWPDVTETAGGVSGLYVSARVKEALGVAGARYGKALATAVKRPYPRKLEDSSAPEYFRLSGELGARVDFAASGFRVLSTCQFCGRIKKDPLSKPTGAQFVEGSWNGSDIFYTDLSPMAMFCSQLILDLAGTHGWTNCRFVPLDQAYDPFHKGLDYLKTRKPSGAKNRKRPLA
jgi:hypothetical protein